MDTATKNVLLFIARWLGFWLVFIPIDMYIVDRYFGTSIVDAMFSQPNYYVGISGLFFIMLTSLFEAIYFYIKEGVLTDSQRVEVAIKTNNLNEHIVFNGFRFCFLILCWFLTDWKVALCYWAAFPFFHDGFYYNFREKIVPGTYPKKWFAQSKTSKALLTRLFPPIVRTILAAISISILIYLTAWNTIY